MGSFFICTMTPWRLDGGLLQSWLGNGVTLLTVTLAFVG